MKRTLKWLSITAAVTAVGGLGWLIWYYQPERLRFYTDADTIRQPIETATPRDILWQPPLDLGEVLNTRQQDYEPRLSWDGLTLYFVRGKAGENADIYFTKRTPTGWTEPAPLEGLNTGYDELGPEPSPDGQSLYFYCDRPGGRGGYDVWVAHRGLEGWQPPINLGPGVNSEFNDYGPAITPEGDTLYFASNRPRPDDTDKPSLNAWPATVREDLFQHTYDLYQAALTDAGAGTAEPIGILNTPFNEGAPCVSPAGDFVYFASDRPGGQGGFDLHRARRLRGDHNVATNLGPSVNTPANELDPGLAQLGFALYFSSDRHAVDATPAQPGDYNLYYTSAREVFTDVEQRSRPPIEWAALWAELSPYLLWLLLALLLLLLMRLLAGAVKDKRLSLLARCLLASLLAHMLMLLLFSFWQVGAALSDAFRRGGRIQISLATPAYADDLALQVRGNLTEVESPEVAPLELQRAEVVPDGLPAEAMTVTTVQRTQLDREEAQPRRETLSDAPEPTIEMAMPSETPIEAEQALLPEVALPVEAERVAESEAEAAVPAAQPPPPTHAKIAYATSQPVQPPLDVAVESQRSDSQMTEVDQSRFVENAAARDSDTSPVQPPTLTVQAVADLPSTPDVALPVEMERVAEFETKTALPEAQPSPPTHAKVAYATKQPVQPPLDVSVESQRSAKQATELDQSRFVDRTVERDSDVRPVRPPTMSVQAVAERPRLPEVALPADRSAPSVVAEVAEAPVEAAAPQPVRTRPPMKIATPPATATPMVVEFPATPRQSETARASALDVVVNDARPTAKDQVGLAQPRTEPALPTAMQLTLPQLEQADTDNAVETAPRVTSAVPSAVRRPTAARALGGTGEPRALLAEVPPSEARDGKIDSAAVLDPHERLRTAPSRRLTPNPAPAVAGPVSTDRLPLELGLPRETLRPANKLAQRGAQQRKRLLQQMGGSDRTEKAVARALAWLARHQSSDGRWDGDGFDHDCGGCGGETEYVVDVALTGLATLCFLGAGHTHLDDGPYRDNVSRALVWLCRQQKPDGDLSAGETMYSHGIAAIALAEAWAMTGDMTLADPVRGAVAFIDAARDERLGGWRYHPGQAGDTSVFGWQVMALKSAETAGVEIPATSLASARQWLPQVESPQYPGLYSYQPRQRPTTAMTAEATFARRTE